MKRLMALVGISAVLMAGNAAALEPSASEPLTKHQILDCMSKRMSADKAISYNDAMKSCKERALVGKFALNANGSPEPAGKSH